VVGRPFEDPAGSSHLDPPVEDRKLVEGIEARLGSILGSTW